MKGMTGREWGPGYLPPATDSVRFRDEMVLLQDMGMACSLFDYDVLAFNEFKPKPPLEADETVIYRGWMMAPDAYAQFVQRIEN